MNQAPNSQMCDTNHANFREEIFKKQWSNSASFVVYCASENLILQTDVDSRDLWDVKIR